MAEIDLLATCLGGAECRQDGVEFFRFQRRDHAVETLLDPNAFDP
jgi:hypothetical protein